MDPYHLYQTNRDIAASIEDYGIDTAVERHGGKTRLLDIGCNEGAYCVAMAPHCSEAIGVEPVQTTIGPTIETAPDNCQFVVRPFRCNMVRGERFDVILMLAVISHLESAQLLARCLASALNPGGTLVFLSHTTGCDPVTDAKTTRFCMEAQRFLHLESEVLVDCRKLEEGDKQGRENLHRRLLTFRNTQTMRFQGKDWRFHAAGGTSRVYRNGDRVLKYFEVEHDRPNVEKQLDRVVEEEAAFLREAAGSGICPRLFEQGTRHLIMDYRGEQPCRRNWPADWREQAERIQQELVRIGKPIGDPALENLLVDENGKLTLIDPAVLEGVHNPRFTSPAMFAERIAHYVAVDLEKQPIV